MSRTVRRILIDDPEFIFPPSLQQVTLYRSMQGTSELHSALAKNKMKVGPKATLSSFSRSLSVVKVNALVQVFYIVSTVTFAWQFLPEFLFPMVAALAPLCWFAPNSHKINFLGSGKGGVGLLNVTLNWSNITSTVITYPYRSVVQYHGIDHNYQPHQVLLSFVHLPIAGLE